MSADTYLERVAEILFPAGDLDHEWSPKDLERIAEVILDWKDGVA